MVLIKWSEAMGVGVSELDTDHRALIDIINELDKAVDTTGLKSSKRRDAVKNALRSLLIYAKYHFGREESVMAACGYDGIDDHIKAHQNFIQKLSAIADNFDADQDKNADAAINDLLIYLKDWLVHHILIEDMAYSALAGVSSGAKEAAKSYGAPELLYPILGSN